MPRLVTIQQVASRLSSPTDCDESRIGAAIDAVQWEASRSVGYRIDRCRARFVRRVPTTGRLLLPSRYDVAVRAIGHCADTMATLTAESGTLALELDTTFGVASPMGFDPTERGYRVVITTDSGAVVNETNPIATEPQATDIMQAIDAFDGVSVALNDPPGAASLIWPLRGLVWEEFATIDLPRIDPVFVVDLEDGIVTVDSFGEMGVDIEFGWTAATCPPDIADEIARLSALAMASEQLDPNIASESLGDYSYSLRSSTERAADFDRLANRIGR